MTVMISGFKFKNEELIEIFKNYDSSLEGAKITKVWMDDEINFTVSKEVEDSTKIKLHNEEEF